MRLTSAYQVLFDLKEPAVLRVVSGTNTIAGKPAFVFLEVLPDEVVFHKGEVIARATIDGRSSTDAIFAIVAGEMFHSARLKAEAAGMVSATGVTPPPELPFATLQELATKAAAANGRVEIKLVAARDLRRAGDSLSLAAVVESR